MAKQIVWTSRALKNFDSVVKYLEEDWSEDVTIAFIKRTYEIIELLAIHPTLGTLEEKKRNIRGFLLTKHNRIFYRITANKLVILNVFDTRQNGRRKKH